ncbi:T9SS type A sorting domain-containing protein [Chitinophagaceae bacterium MMS25-I14]
MKKLSFTRILLTVFVMLMCIGVTRAQVNVTATGGTTSATYTTLNAAFTAINAGTHTGTISIVINNNTTEPATPVPLLASGTGSSSYTAITIAPSGNVTINSAAAPATNRGIIELAGADNVTINGDDPSTSGTQNLTIQSVTSTTAGIACIRLSSNSSSGADGANNVTVKNCNIIGARSSATATDVSYGIQFSDGTSTSSSGTGAYSSLNTVIQSNVITRCYYGIHAIGNSTSYYNTGLQILNNTLGNATSANNIGLRGIDISYTSGAATGAAVISGNDIMAGDYGTSGYGATIAGIEVGTSTSSTIIKNNNIHDINQPSTGGYGAHGIYITGSGSGMQIYNNFVRDCKMYVYQTSMSSQYIPIGVFFGSGSSVTNVVFNHNTIVMNPQLAASTTYSSACLDVASSSVTFTQVLNNIFVNNHASSNAFGFYNTATSNISGATVNNNDYYVVATAQIGYYNSARATLAAWQSATGKDAAALNANPSFVSATNLHINSGTFSQLESAGASAATTGITTDIDGQTRPGPAGSVNGGGTAPDMGADEFDAIPAQVPAISNATASAVSCVTAAAHTVTATIVANTGTIGTATLNYNNGSAGTVAMTLSSGTTANGVWTGTIPAGTAGVAVSWSITATNTVPLSTTVTGTSYTDVPLGTATAVAAASVNPVCSGSPTNLTATLNSSGTITVGAGGTTASSYDGIFYHLYGGAKTQFLIRASELTALGLSAGNITALSINMSTVTSQSYAGFAINIAATTNTDLSGGLVNSGLNQVYSAASYTPVTGANAFSFSTPFAWDGTSNIVIQFCWSNNNGGGTSNYAKIDAPGFVSCAYYRADNQTPSAICGATTNTSTTSNRPQFIFTGNAAPAITAYSWSNGSTTIGTTSPLTVNPTASTTYTATVTAGGCTKTTAPLTVNVTSLPASPTASNSVQCGVGVPTASVSGGSGIYKWYSASTGGTLLQRGGSTYTSSISTTTTFYVVDSNGLCESARVPVIATVTTPDALTVNSSQASLCPAGSVTLTAAKTGTSNNYTYTWTASPATGSGIPTSLSGASVTVTPTATGTYTYTVTGVDGSCTAVATKTITVNPNPNVSNVTAKPTSVCSGSNDTLSAMSINATAGTAAVGTQATTDITGGPYREGACSGNKAQYLFTAAELTAAGLTTGNITSLAFNVTSLGAGGAMANYTIKIAATTATALTSAFDNTPGTTVFGPVSYTAVSGTNTHTFTTPFNWDGVSNIVVTLCHDYLCTGSSSVSMASTTNKTLYDNSGSTSNCSVTTGTSTSNRPVITFAGQVGTNVTGTMTWSWAPGAVSGSTVVVNPTNTGTAPSTVTYTVTATNATTGCSATGTVNVTVNPLPAAPVATNSTQCGVGVPTASVSGAATGNTYKWYSAATGGTLLQSGGATYTTAISTTTTFYVAVSNGTCESSRTPVTVTVNIPDPVTAKANNTTTTVIACINAPLALSATKTGTTNNYTYTWTASPVAGSGIPAGGTTGQNISVTPTVAGTYVYTVTGIDGICTAISTVSVTIKDPFAGIPLTATASPAAICAGSSDTLRVLLGPANGVLFTEPFETASFPLTSFTTASVSGTVSATQNTTYSSQGASSILFNTPSTGADVSLSTTNSVSLQGYTSAQLTFSQIAAMEGYIASYDYGYVQYSTDGGSTWTSFPTSSYAGTGTLFNSVVSFSTLSYSNWTSALTGASSTPTNSLWQNETINIPAAALTSTQFKIRFRYTTDGSINYYGWLIDNVKITAVAPVPTAYSWSNGATVVGTTTPLVVTPTSTTTYTPTVTLNGCSKAATGVVVTVNPLPTATITPGGTGSFCAGSTGLVLSANTGTGLTYQWNLNGTAINNATNQTYTATAAGSYTVVVSNGPCNATSAATVVSVTPLPTATLTAQGPVTFCTGGNVVLKANSGSGLTYVWKKNAVVISGVTDSSYTATTSGSYTVDVTRSGCTATSSAIVVTVNTPPTATITAGGPLTFCQGNGVTLTANSGTGFTYQWNLNGNPISGATNQAWFAAVSGSYTVTVNNGCSATSTARVVTVLATPTATITPAGPTSFCIGGSVILNANTGTGLTYRWFNGATQVGTGSSYTATTSGSYTVRVTNTNGCNTTSSAVVVTVFALPVAVITPLTSTVICQGETATLSAGTGTGLTYQWFNNSVAIAGATNNTLTTGAAGNYTVRITNANGCVATSASVLIEVVQLPGATITYTTPLNFCNGNSVVLSANTGTGFTYQWNHDGTPVAGATNATYTATTAGNYTVDVRNSNGCLSTSAAVTVTVYMLSTPIISRNGAVLSSTGYAAYQWYLNGTAIPGATNASYTVTQNGYYTVEGTDANGCVNMSAIAQWPNLGVGNTAGGKDLKIYPNPTTSILYIDAPVTVDVSVSSLDGKELIYQKEAKQIDLGNLADGVYMLKILDQNKVVLKIEKLIKAAK